MKKTIRSFCKFSNWSKKPLASMLLIFVGNYINAQNLITNGDFETSGGFTSNYNLTAGPNSNQREYGIVTNPNTLNPNFSSTCTGMGGSGKMMAVDGGASSGDKVWEQSPGGGIPVIVGKTYTFSYWIQSISITNAPGNLADIEVRLNNTILTPVSGSTVCPASLCNWTQVTYSFVATTGYAQIWLFDKQTSSTGNDFALDNLSLTKVPDPLTLTYAAVNPTCPNGNDGFITAYPAGGFPPYSYTLNGTTTNSTGIFTGLSASTGNSITVTDAATTPATKTVTGITLTDPIDPLTVTGNSPICSGASANLAANGGSSGIYNWTSNPVDPTLTSSGANPTANPTVTTKYYATTNHTTIKELIYNGHFDNSTNLGFNSDYANIPNNDANKVQKAFGVVVNPKTFESGFSICADHTTAGGNQMVVDGSTVANDKIWSQTIPVNPGTTYTFSYYVQTVSASSPAQIETQVNGSPITGTAATSRFTSLATACSWSNVTYTWNSGAATSATLALIDRNITAAGNDFALDDLSFYTTSVCPLVDSITIVVNPAGTPVTGFSYATPVCKTGTNPTPIKVAGFSNGGIFSAAPLGLSIDPSTGVIDLSLSTVNTYTVTYTYAASGCNPLASSNTSITITPPPVAGTLSGNQNICVGGSTTFASTVTGGNWSSGDISKATINASTGIINGVASGTVTMTYTITGTGGCANATATRTVTVTDPPSAGTLSGTQNICVGGNTTFSSTVTGGSWSSGDITKATINASTGAINGIASGTVIMTYTVTGTGGCSNATATRNVTVTDPPSAGTLSGVQNICVGGNTNFSSTVTGGSWSSGDISKATINASTGAINGIAAGTVTMTYTITGTGGCANATATRTVTVTAAPTAGTLSGSQNICTGNSTTFSSTVTGGSWSSSDITKATINASTGTINGIAAGTVTMTYTVTGTGGCSNATATRNVTITDPPSAGTLSGSQNICIGGSTTFASTIAGGTWSSADVSKATINASTGAIASMGAGTVTMTYTVTGTGGCANATATRDVIIASSPTAGTLSGVQSVCVGSTTTFSSTIPGGVWSSSDITNAPINATTGVINGIAVTSATMTYKVTGTGGCSDASATRTVTVNPLLALSADTKACEPGNINYRVSFTATAGTAPFTVTGSGAPGTWIGNNWTSGLIPATTGSNYSIAVHDVNNCNTINVNGTAPDCSCPAKAVVSGGGSACADGTKVTVSIALSGTPPWNIIYNNGTTSIPVNNILTSPYTFQTDIAGTYVVTTVSDATCTGTSSGNALVNIVALPTATISGTTSICPNTTTNITFNGTANTVVTYTINGGANQTIALNATGTATLTTPSLNVTTTYSLVSVATTGTTVCTQSLSGSAVVSINSATVPVTDFNYTPNTVCIGGTNPILNPAPGFTSGGVFSVLPTGLTIDNATGAITVATSVANTYTITYAVAATGCSPAKSSTTTFTVTALAIPVTDFSYTPNSICVNGTDPTLTTSPGFAMGGTYSVTPSGLIINATTGAVTVAGSLANNYTITYSVAATSCSAAKTSTANIAIIDLPLTPLVTVTDPTCVTPTGTVTVTNTLTGLTFSKDGINYTNTTGVFNGLAPGSAYSITAKNTSGCISAASTGTIGSVPGAPAIPAVTVTQPTCTTATATISVTSPAAGSAYSNDGINYTNTTGVFSGLAAGSSYSISLKNAAGCVSSPTTGTIDAQPPIPARPTVAITQPTCSVPTGVISVSSSTSGLTFSNDGINYSNTSGIFPDINAGSGYSITAKNSIGCISPAATGVINAQPPPTLANAGPDKQISLGESIQLDGVASGNNVSITWTPNIAITGSNSATPIVSPIADQVYTMTVRSVDGCVATDEVTVMFQKDIIVPNVFSPNNDGTNDTWKITNIEDYPEVSVQVFNRYGQFIFGSVGYTIRWDGKYKGQPVPVGPYYWIIKLRPNKKPISGTISVVR